MYYSNLICPTVSKLMGICFVNLGTVIRGKMITDVKFYYPIGSTVQYDCDSGLPLNGASMLECLENGVWSSAVPTCGKPNANTK